MKKLLVLASFFQLVILGTGVYFGYRMWTFNKEVSSYLGYVEKGLECFSQINGRHSNDLFSLSHGGKVENYGIYFHKIPQCDEYYKERCWIIDFDRPDLLEKCNVSQELINRHNKRR